MSDLIYTVLYNHHAYKAELVKEEAFKKAMEHLPVEQRARALSMHYEMKERMRKEKQEERRHQELCDAIRSTKPTGQSNALWFLLGMGIGK